MDREAWDQRYREKELVWSAGPNRFLVEEASALAPGRALDLACGEGRNALWLAERGWQVTATDFSPVAIDKAKQIAASRGLKVDWRVADVLEPLDARERFDLVLVFYLHLPWPEMERALEVARGALAPGGLFLLVGHDRRNLDEGVGGPPDPKVLYGPEEVTSALRDLSIERAETVERPVETGGGTAIALDVLVRGRAPA